MWHINTNDSSIFWPPPPTKKKKKKIKKEKRKKSVSPHWFWSRPMTRNKRPYFFALEPLYSLIPQNPMTDKGFWEQEVFRQIIQIQRQWNLTKKCLNFIIPSLKKKNINRKGLKVWSKQEPETLDFYFWPIYPDKVWFMTYRALSPLGNNWHQVSFELLIQIDLLTFWPLPGNGSGEPWIFFPENWFFEQMKGFQYRHPVY